MPIQHTLFALVSASLLASCAVPDAAADTDHADTDRTAAQTASGTPTLACNLEYENLSPFQTAPVGSFVLPYAQFVSQGGAVVSDGHYQLSVSLNPSPATNLSFNVQISNVQTAKDTAYAVLPPPQVTAGYILETGARISALTKNGVTFDHIRAYCSYTLAP